MKYFNQHMFFGLFCVLYTQLKIVFCTDNVYEQISQYVQDSQIVDPHSLYYNRQTKSIEIPKNYDDLNQDSNNIVSKDVSNNQLYCKDSPYEVFARRLINMLVLKSSFKSVDGVVYGKLDLQATIEELEIIKGFGEGKVSIRQIDRIISNVIRPIQTNLFDNVLSYTDELRIYLYQNKIIFGTILLTVFVILISLKVKWTRFRVIILIFDIIFVISYLMTWWELVQESIIKSAAMQKMYSMSPSVCQENDINFSSSITFLISRYTGFAKDDCVQYYDAVMSDPVLKVTPIHALNHMCSKFLFYPVSVAAYYLSQSIETYTGTLSWPVSAIVKGPLFICMPIIIGILIFLFFGGSMGFRVGPFIHLYLHGKQPPPPSMLLDRNDRQAIEVIHSNTSKDSITPIVKAKKKKSKHIKTITNFENIEHQEIKKQAEIEDLSDEFPELKEYEKISRRRLENEMNKICNMNADEKNYFEKEEARKISELRTKNKISLVTESGDY